MPNFHENQKFIFLHFGFFHALLNTARILWRHLKWRHVTPANRALGYWVENSKNQAQKLIFQLAILFQLHVQATKKLKNEKWKLKTRQATSASKKDWEKKTDKWHHYDVIMTPYILPTCYQEYVIYIILQYLLL